MPIAPYFNRGAVNRQAPSAESILTYTSLSSFDDFLLEISYTLCWGMSSLFMIREVVMQVRGIYNDALCVGRGVAGFYEE